MTQDQWDKFFLKQAYEWAGLSKDPDTQVGSVIVNARHRPLSAGYNGFPTGIEDSVSRLNNREVKLELMVHAECNAIDSAAHEGIALKGSTLYLLATDDTGKVWGGAPCIRCTMNVIQAGVKRIVAPPPKSPSKWELEVARARDYLTEAGIEYVEVPSPLNA